MVWQGTVYRMIIKVVISPAIWKYFEFFAETQKMCSFMFHL